MYNEILTLCNPLVGNICDVTWHREIIQGVSRCIATYRVNRCFMKIARIKYNVNNTSNIPRANGVKRRSGRKPGARVTNPAIGKFKVAVHGSKVLVCHDVTVTDLNTMADYRVE